MELLTYMTNPFHDDVVVIEVRKPPLPKATAKRHWKCDQLRRYAEAPAC